MSSTPPRREASRAAAGAPTAPPRRNRRPAPRRPALRLALQTGPGIAAAPASRAQLRRWILATLAHDAELTLRFVGRREARTLNAGYRSRDYAPDVLTFIYQGSGPIRADIVLCMPVLREQARAARQPARWRLAHLVVHGTLHAQGYDHERDTDACVMQALETAALKRFRIPDPYSDD